MEQSSGDKIPLGAILAGGRGSRLGRDKANLSFGGQTLLERVRDALATVCDRVVVVGGMHHIKGATTIPDSYPEANSMGGIATALRHCAETVGPKGWVVTVACDMPFISPALLRLLWQVRGGGEVVVPQTAAGYEPLCALYSVGALPVVEELLESGNLRLMEIFARLEKVEVGEAALRGADPELHTFYNINRPDDLEKAYALLDDISLAGGEKSG